MIPFPGQSIGCIDAYGGGAGWFLYEDIWHRASSRAITAGDDWYCFAYHQTEEAAGLLEAGDPTPLAVSWVVEVLAGSGTLALYDFDDAGFTESTNPADYGSLGSITVSGSGTYTLPTSTFSRDAIRTAGWSGGTLAVRLSCTSGSVEVQQVKLRVWPSSGPVGGWSDPYADDPGVTGATPSQISKAATGLLSEYPTQVEFRAGLAASTLATFANSTIVTAGGMFAVYDAPSDTTRVGGGGPGAGYLYRDTSNFRYTPPGTLGVDWLLPPDEVEDDAPAVLFQSTGEDAVQWTQGHATVVYDSDAFDELGRAYEGTVSLGYEVVDAVDPDGTFAMSVLSGLTIESATPSGHAPIFSDVTLPEFPAGKYLRLVVSHNGFYTDIPPDGGAKLALYYGTTADEVTFDRLRWSWTPAPYRYWTPTAAPAAQPLRLMQRGDGLGMGSGRVYATGTRQASTRVFGSL
jgi:hypothetical protein